MAQDSDDIPKVVGGKLTHPYPIRTRGDLHRARVLPPPKVGSGPQSEQPHLRFPAKDDAMARREPTSEQPKGAFDYVRKRNKLLREMSGGRSPGGKR